MAMHAAREDFERDESASTAQRPSAVPNRRSGFVQVGNAFVLDPTVPNDAKLLLMVFYAEAKGAGMVRLSQREIRDRTNMPPERQDDALDWIATRGLVDVLTKKGAKPTFVLKPALLLDWQQHADWPRADETRKPREPVGKARRMMEARRSRAAATPLFEPSATSGNPEPTESAPPSATSGKSVQKLPLPAETPAKNRPLIAESPSATSGNLPHTKMTKTTKLNTSSISDDDGSLAKSVDDACEALRQAGVNIYPHEVGINRGTSRRLTSADLLIWLAALDGFGTLQNPAGYVAKAIRLGVTFDEDRSGVAHRARQRAAREQRTAGDQEAREARERAEEESAQQLDAAIATLSVEERRQLERAALQTPVVWNARDTAPEVFERILRTLVRKAFRGELSAASGNYNYIRSRNARRVRDILGDDASGS